MNIAGIKELNEKCSGCSACYNECNYDAISMEMDKEGFYFPVIYEEKCVHCGACVKVCQIENLLEMPKETTECYSAYVKDDKVRLASSSGGIFSVLATCVKEKNNGEVYGAAFNKNKKEVCHGRLGDYSLEELRRSKYVQSNLEDTFCEIKQFLKEGRQVLFCGTPCQVKGLRCFLKKDYPNLLMTDFSCHGSPSVGVFKDMILYFERKYNGKIVNVTFREKDLGWERQVMKFYFEDGRVITEKSEKSFYYYSFLNNLSLRKSCFNCDYMNSSADIRLGDFWGRDKSIDDNKGISFVEINTEKGKKFWKQISEINIQYQKQSEDANDINYYSRQNGLYNIEKRNKFFTYYFEKEWKKAVYVYVKIRIGLKKIRSFLGKCKRKIRLLEK